MFHFSSAIWSGTSLFSLSCLLWFCWLSYVEKENLVKPANKAMVVLDATLCDALFKGTIKKGSTYPTEIHKKDLGSAFLNRMQVHFRVARGNEVAVRKGAIKPVQIMTERRQGNKKVTRLSGLESFLMDAESLASELQKKFACSTSVAELPGTIAFSRNFRASFCFRKLELPWECLCSFFYCARVDAFYILIEGCIQSISTSIDFRVMMTLLFLL